MRAHEHLGEQITEDYWGSSSLNIHAFHEAYTANYLEYRGSTLRVDLYTLFSTKAHYLARSKKALMIALQYDLVSIIEFQAWNDTCCVPFDLFLTHIAPILQGRPRHISVKWDTTFRPMKEEGRS